jgi:chloramphenicol-sensitive protein RarD
MTETSSTASADSRQGFLLAALCYAIWGLLPLYFKMLGHAGALEVLSHRILWSVPLAGAILVWQGRGAETRASFVNSKMLAYTAVTSAIIAVNWGTYVWAVVSGHALETALGYYINPLFSIFLASIFLGERLKPLQVAAIGLAVVAVLILTWETGGLPWVSVVLPVTWGFYALLKRTMPVGPTVGFTMEVAILALPCLAYVIWLETQASGHFAGGGTSERLLLMGTGVMTAVPLILYANAAKLLRLSTIAIMQYSAPTVVFLTAVFIFKEPFSTEKLLAFVLIWTALVLYSWEALRPRRR